MGQQEIAEVLKKHYPEYLYYKEIIAKTGLPKNQVIKNLCRMRKRDECEIRISKSKQSWRTEYRIK